MRLQKQQTAAAVRKIAVGAARYLILLSFGYVLLYPFLYIFINSIKHASNLIDPTVQWIPKQITFEAFPFAYRALDFVRSFKNTLLFQICPALLQACSAAVAAYGLARFNFKVKKVYLAMMFLNLFVPAAMIVIPSYLSFYQLDFLGILGLVSKVAGTELRPDLTGTPLAMYLPSALGVGLKGGLFIYIYRQFFMNLPKELEDAAWVDGAGPLKTFLKIIVPSSGPAVITVMLFSVIWHWNEYISASLYFPDDPPLGVSLSRIPSTLSNSEFYSLLAGKNTGAIILAGCLLFVAPVLVFYLILQKRFVESINTSGIVG